MDFLKTDYRLNTSRCRNGNPNIMNGAFFKKCKQKRLHIFNPYSINHKAVIMKQVYLSFYHKANFYIPPYNCVNKLG